MPTIKKGVQHSSENAYQTLIESRLASQNTGCQLILKAVTVCVIVKGVPNLLSCKVTRLVTN